MSFSSSHTERTIRRIRRLAVDTCATEELRAILTIRELAACINSGPLAAVVSPRVIERLLTRSERDRIWLFLSCRRETPTQVVIGDDPYECAELHACELTFAKDPSTYRESALTVAALIKLRAALLGSADYCGAAVAATMATLHVLGLLPFDPDIRQKYLQHPTRPLGVLPEHAYAATHQQNIVRQAYTAARRAIKQGPFNPIGKIFAAAARHGRGQSVHRGFDVIAQAAARGFVELCDLERYRSPYADENGFITKEAMLARLTPPAGWAVIDIDAFVRVPEELGTLSRKPAQESVIDSAGPAHGAPRV
jgi:hypothetical protein